MYEPPIESLYLYGIIAGDAPPGFSARGVGERAAPVYALAHAGLAALVSPAPPAAYAGSRRTRMAHTRVLEEAMAAHTVLPAPYGTVAPDARALMDMLAERSAELRAQLAALDGRIELDLKAFWFEEVLFSTLVARHPPIRELCDRLAGRVAEETYYERIRLGGLMEAAMARQRAEEAAQILARMAPIVERSHLGPPLTDQMVLNAAFLIERERGPAFDSAVQQLHAELGRRMMFEYVGPVPPYSFVTMPISWGGP